MLREIASARQPLNALIEFALREKGAMVVPDAVHRYADMLSTAIAADEGDDVSKWPWGDFVGSLDGSSKFESAVFALGQTLNASEAEMRQFITITDGVTAIMSGDDPDEVESEIETALERDDAFNASEVEAFSHLDEESQEYEQEYLEARISAADDGSPSHIDEGDEL